MATFFSFLFMEHFETMIIYFTLSELCKLSPCSGNGSKKNSNIKDIKTILKIKKKETARKHIFISY